MGAPRYPARMTFPPSRHFARLARPVWLGFAAAFALSGLVAGIGRAAALGLAWDDPTTGRSFVASVSTDSPEAFEAPPTEVPGDGVLRFAAGQLFHVSRDVPVITRIDIATGAAVQSYSFAAGTELRDLALVDGATAWVSDRASTHLLALDLVSGAIVPAVDLAPLGVSPGVLSPERMLLHEGLLYLQLRRPMGLGMTSEIAVLDVAGETIVDADPSATGLQGVALAGTEPRFKMQVVPGTRRLMLSATGALLDSGGIETINLDTLRSEGVLLADDGGLGVNDFGPFVMIDDRVGWFSGATSIVASSHLHSFDITNPAPSIAVGNEIFFNAPHVVYEATSNRIFWPTPTGLRIFDATTGAEASGSPVTLLAGTITDIEGIASPRPVPGPAGYGGLAVTLLLGLVLTALGAYPGRAESFRSP